LLLPVQQLQVLFWIQTWKKLATQTQIVLPMPAAQNGDTADMGRSFVASVIPTVSAHHMPHAVPSLDTADQHLNIATLHLFPATRLHLPQAM